MFKTYYASHQEKVSTTTQSSNLPGGILHESPSATHRTIYQVSSGWRRKKCITSQDNMLYYVAYMPAHAASRQWEDQLQGKKCLVCVCVCYTHTNAPASIYLSKPINSLCVIFKVTSMFKMLSALGHAPLLTDDIQHKDIILIHPVKSKHCNKQIYIPPKTAYTLVSVICSFMLWIILNNSHSGTSNLQYKVSATIS